jgi:molybdopterin-containing oxidoreductase family iron-sulfur binding subunit
MEFSRRTFLKVAAISGATLASDAGVKYVDKLVPSVKQPYPLHPVEWHTLATTCRECPAGCGMHIRHRDGRITKAEGNPDHPVNRGGLCARGQSALQGIYDPGRVSGVHARDQRNGPFRQETWQNAFAKIGERLQQSNGRVAIMSRLETGTLVEIMSAFAGSFGSNRVLLYEAFNYDPLRKANASLFGQAGIPYYDLGNTDYILSFGADFLESWISNVQFAWQYADMHELKDGKIGRCDYVGPRLSMTAANADKYVPVSPGREKDLALAILKVMVDENMVKEGRAAIGPMVGNIDVRAAAGPTVSEQDIRTMARRFASSRSVALAGPVGASGPEAEQLARIVGMLNAASGNIGSRLDFARNHALSNTATEEQVAAFLGSLTANDVVFIHKTNPAFTRPGSEELLKKAGLIVYLGTLLDETASIADWYLPVHDDLESWGEYQPWTGVQSLMQPTMRSLADSFDAGDLLLRLAAAQRKTLRKAPDGSPIRTTRDWLLQRWRARFPQAGWVDAVRNGGDWSAFKNMGRKGAGLKTTAAGAGPAVQAPGKNEAELWLWPSIMFFDGRTANRGWLQEAPEPVSTVMWNSWIDVPPQKATALGISDGDVIELAAKDNQTLQAPARVTPEVAEDTVAICFGQGHTALGENAANVGANAFKLLPRKPGFEGYFGRVTIRKTGKKERMHFGMTTKEQHDRELLRWVNLDTARTMKPGPLTLPLPEGYAREKDLYAPHKHYRHRWAMSIDLQRCIGCGACAVACYAENNLLVVGRDGLGGQRGVLRSTGEWGLKGTNEGRIMAWLRIVPYRHKDDPLRVGFLPMPCQHCDAAPCEPVCPVFAAVNNEEGLNAQIYNRCIGTRYCSNNCPYKVRRFNWMNTYWKPPLNWQLNPEVTVRSRGVMEKCTFCVQRIRNAEYRARRENRRVRDGEVQPACVQSCPAKVFTFGDLLDPESKISRITREHPRRYHVLEELNTKPAVTYLFRILQEEKA